jgi:hypothetical protein
MDSNTYYIIKHGAISNLSVVTDGRVIQKMNAGQEFKAFSRQYYKSLGCDYPKFYKMDNLCKLAFLASEILLKTTEQSLPPENTAMLLANSGSTIDTDVSFANTLDKIPSPAIFVYTLPNIMVGELSIRYGWKGENLFLISDTFNPAELDENLQMLFASSDTEICISGWVDFLSEKDYKASLWLVSRKQYKACRELNTMELSYDFDLN